MRPSMRGACLSRSRWLVTVAVGLGAPSGPSFCANVGQIAVTANSVTATMTRRTRARKLMTIILLPFLMRGQRHFGERSDLDVLMISRQPPPSAGAVAALE